MSKSLDAFRTISEVSDELDTPAHVLRFWESKFSQVKPVKRAGGRRYYRPTDLDLLAGIKKLLHDDGMTIKGAQKLLREQGVKHVGSLGAAAMLAAQDATKLDTDAVDVLPIDAAPTAEATTPLEVEITNVVTLPDPAPKGPVLSLDLAPKATPSDQTDPRVAAQRSAKAVNVPADPSDKDSKATARLFHLLHKASHAKLAAQAEAIAPLLDRMQNLRDSISLR
ncbi:MerR family transcriptional regulator [Octadecabacter antarcticus 307]|uniref:MerR family transcriptional regulator n=1 Tax=Octadecabacter antarcticus 307 TaxID=391626 RepID=M9RET6_9RHOB|nr:MerR family transcriptional regulator [Octadecabacter antarcticus]AGI68315.1 MerR family transcriptional regulator [Octadecabacter antarcticus 307]